MGGLVGIGLVAKGIMDHLTSKRAFPLCACKYDSNKHQMYTGQFMIEIERINMKLDAIREELKDDHRKA